MCTTKNPECARQNEGSRPVSPWSLGSWLIVVYHRMTFFWSLELRQELLKGYERKERKKKEREEGERKGGRRRGERGEKEKRGRGKGGRSGVRGGGPGENFLKCVFRRFPLLVGRFPIRFWTPLLLFSLVREFQPDWRLG